MKLSKYIFSVSILTGIVLIFSAYTMKKVSPSNERDLYQTISELDSTFFTAYNNCDLETQGKLIAEDLEFYHDQGGLNTSKVEVMTAMEKNICGKVTRELVKGSTEVSPIAGFGAVQMGMHKFHNNQEPNAVPKASRFVTLWKQTGDSWQMTRIISLHSN